MTEEELKLVLSEMMSGPRASEAPRSSSRGGGSPKSSSGRHGYVGGGVGSSPGVTPAAPMADYLMKFGNPGAMLEAYRGGATSTPGTKRANMASTDSWNVLMQGDVGNRIVELLRRAKSYGGGGRASVSGSSGSQLSSFGGDRQRETMEDQRAYEQQRRMAELSRSMEMRALKEKLGLFGSFLGQNGGSNTTTRESYGGEYTNVGGRPVWSPTKGVEKTTSPSLTAEMILNFLRG